ncbi:hypothetical protein CY0110_18062 [Crocosphaera chwakensis CCY0110]|uniref:Uncharacterized protein n=1 Tax=Crocosphaera chwakensis CCY0110 TaxID=391612 RepID=A3IIU4_9CHRO|nr:hypothetical protein CY0110_18062 [Crocosphaera chwakensis CCY0110]
MGSRCYHITVGQGVRMMTTSH